MQASSFSSTNVESVHYAPHLGTTHIPCRNIQCSSGIPIMIKTIDVYITNKHAAIQHKWGVL